MQKYGLDPRINYDLWVFAGSYDAYKLKREIRNYLIEKNFYKAEKMILDEKNLKLLSGDSDKQFLLIAQTSIADFKKENSVTIIKTLLQAIKMTIKDFNEQEIEKYNMCFDEITLVNKLALEYTKVGEHERSLMILEKLKASMDMYYVDQEEKARTYIMVLYNLSKRYGDYKRFPEEIDLCEIAIKMCYKNNKLKLLPHVFTNYACALCETENKQKGAEYFAQAYVLFLAYNNTDYAKSVKEKAAKDYKIKINFMYKVN